MTEAAVKWFQECVEKCDFIDAKGVKIQLDVKAEAKGARQKHADGATKKAAEKVKKQGAKAGNKPPPILKWMEIAKKEIGQKEIAGKDNNARIVQYHSTTTLKATKDETPWCSSFVNWVMTQSGYKGTNSASAFSWKSWGKRVSEPCSGAIAVFDHGKGAGHVGFVSKKRRWSNDTRRESS